MLWSIRKAAPGRVSPVTAATGVRHPDLRRVCDIDSGFVITPVVAFGGRQRPRRDPREVASVHRVPLERFMAPGVPRRRIDEEGRSLPQMPLGPSIVIHAPTGAILWQFAEVAPKGRDLRVAGVAQPHWTRR